MNHLPFDKPGRFWRGNLHTHSTRSDGRRPPEAVCQHYQEAGYDFISLTDHFLAQYDFPITDTRPYRNERFTTIIGAELHAGETELGGIWHLVGVGLPLDFAPPQNGESGPELAARAKAAGAFVGVAHPQWYTLTPEDIVSLGDVDAIEIFNGVAVDHNDRGDSWHIAEIMLGRGHRYFTYAADDCHFIPNHADFDRGWVMVKAETLEPDALLAALKAGHFYSSTGPQIYDVEVTDSRQVNVRCSPATRVWVTGSGPGAKTTEGHGMLEVTLDASGMKSPYLRVTVCDAQGGRAWTNPIWLD